MGGLRDENWARLQGLIASLNLPTVRRADGTFRRRTVQIELPHGAWADVFDALVVDDDVMCVGNDEIEYSFAVDAVPRWRFKDSIVLEVRP